MRKLHAMKGLVATSYLIWWATLTATMNDAGYPKLCFSWHAKQLLHVLHPCLEPCMKISIDSSFRSQLYFWLPFGALGVWDAVPGFLLCLSTCWLQGWWFPLWTLSDFLPPAYSLWLARRPYLANFAQQFTGFISCLEVGGNPLIGWTSAEYGHYVVNVPPLVYVA